MKNVILALVGVLVLGGCAVGHESNELQIKKVVFSHICQPRSAANGIMFIFIDESDADFQAIASAIGKIRAKETFELAKKSDLVEKDNFYYSASSGKEGVLVTVEILNLTATEATVEVKYDVCRGTVEYYKYFLNRQPDGWRIKSVKFVIAS
jgi:hypothetical protein